MAVTRAPRLAMTPALMRELKDQIRVEKMSKYDKRLIWSIYSYWASLRLHEILSVKQDEFTPDKAMVWSDGRLDRIESGGQMVDLVRLKIRNPKKSRAQHSTQFGELVETGGLMCLLNASIALEQRKTGKEGENESTMYFIPNIVQSSP